MSYYFVIVGTLDNPIYEAHLTTSKSSVSSSVPPAPLSEHPSYSLMAPLISTDPSSEKSVIGYAGKDTDRGRHVVQLVAHASLDAIDSAIWSEKSMYLRQIDRFHEWTVSAWIPPGGMKFILLHEIKNDEGIKSFFFEAWELFVKHQLSPFYEINSPILSSSSFDQFIKLFARKHL
ncbi:Sedlin [Phakopsora pachyrhizi]|nr:Sedlin [Phakopsora pachyrhizi]